MAEFCSVGDAVDAAPDDFLSAVDVPSYTLIRLPHSPQYSRSERAYLLLYRPRFFLRWFAQDLLLRRAISA